MNDLEDTLNDEVIEELEQKLGEMPDWLLGKGDEGFFRGRCRKVGK